MLRGAYEAGCEAHWWALWSPQLDCGWRFIGDLDGDAELSFRWVRGVRRSYAAALERSLLSLAVQGGYNGLRCGNGVKMRIVAVSEHFGRLSPWDESSVLAWKIYTLRDQPTIERSI